MRLPFSSHPSPTMCAHPACISAWGRHYNIQAVAFDLLIAFSLIFPRTHGFRSTTIPAVINNNKLSLHGSVSATHYGHVPVPPRGILLRIEEQSRPHRRENCRPACQHEHGRPPACLTRRIPFPPHLACSFPPHLIPIPPCTPTLHVLVRGVDTIPYKPWHSTSSSHSHSFSPRTHGFRSTTIPAVI